MESIKRKILYYRVTALLENLPQITTAAIVLPILAYFVFDSQYMVYWVVVDLTVALLLVGKTWSLKLKLRETDSAQDLNRCVFWWGLQSYFFAFMWAILPWMQGNNDVKGISLCGFIIAGVTAGTTMSSVPFPKVARNYGIITLGSLVTRIFYGADPDVMPVAIMCVFYALLMYRFQKTLFGYFLKTYETLMDLDAANLEIKTSREAAVTSSRLAAQAEMTAHLAHEVNNPLAIIQLKIEFLLRSLRKGTISDPLVQEVCEKSLEMIHRIQNIITSTKKYFYHSEVDDTHTEVELQELIDEIVGIYQEKCHLRGILFERKGVENIVVRGGRTAVLQVVTNLLNNAFDAVKDHREAKIILSTQNTQEGVIIKVQDSGEGILKEEREKIFEPFYTTKGKGSGLGMGLSICVGLAREMGGDLWLADGSPTTFCFMLKKASSENQVSLLN